MFNVVIIGGEFTDNYEKFQEKCIFYLKSKAEKVNVFVFSLQVMPL